MAAMPTMASTVTTTTTASASATPTAATTTTGTPTAATTVSTIPSIATVSAVSGVWSAFAIKVRLIWLVGKIAAAFDHQRATLDGLALRRHRRGFCAATTALRRHLRPLLFQDGLAGQSDAVALHGENLHQYLVTFLQFVANIRDAMLGHFADMQ